MAQALRTELCRVVGIDVPVIQAGMSVHTSPALVVAVSEAGGLGSLGAWGRSVAALGDHIRQIREGTAHPFAVNYLPPDLDAESFALTLAAGVPVISFAAGDPGDLVARAHEVGSLVTVQVTTVEYAEQAAELGVDVIIAQGGEAGGYGGEIATTVLVPQVVRRVDPVPVVAAGGFVDGAGLVAALALGACGVSVGTRFLATVESPIHADYQRRILAASAADAVKSPRFNLLSPNPGAVGYGTVVRVLRSAFIERVASVEQTEDVAGLVDELVAAQRVGTAYELVAAAGQSAGRVERIESASEVVRQLVAEAHDVLTKLAALTHP
jgi:nitronate monooxygenase/enoyl-[acyl-carrier protein] reductase II